MSARMYEHAESGHLTATFGLRLNVRGDPAMGATTDQTTDATATTAQRPVTRSGPGAQVGMKVKSASSGWTSKLESAIGAVKDWISKQ